MHTKRGVLSQLFRTRRKLAHDQRQVARSGRPEDETGCEHAGEQHDIRPLCSEHKEIGEVARRGGRARRGRARRPHRRGGLVGVRARRTHRGAADDKRDRMRPETLLARRAFLYTSALAAVASPPSAILAAGAPPSCSPSVLRSAQQTLSEVEQLVLGSPTGWAKAQSLLDTVDAVVLERSLDACVDPKTLKEQAMNNAAFIVYYEERRYGDLRLEPQTPSLRAEQNGKKKEFLRALDDEKKELTFLLNQQDDDATELRQYASLARKVLSDFLQLLPGAG